MSRTIVHIGLPRTASTWFQSNFFSQVKNYALVNRKIVQDTLIHPSSLNFKPDFFLKKLPENQNMIISEEMVSGRIRGGIINHFFLKEFNERIKTCLPDSQVIIFLRKQSDLAASLYNLYIQKGGTYGMNKFLHPIDRIHDLNLFSPEFLNYKPLLESLINCFGKERLSVFLFEDFEDNSTAFLIEMCKRFNFEVDLSKIDLSPKNTGLNRSGLIVKRLVNHFTRHGIPFKHYYFHLPGVYNINLKKHIRKAAISKDFETIQGEYFDSNNWIMENFDLPQMKTFGYCS